MTAKVIKGENGQLYLEDPVALEVIQTVEAHNKKVAYENCLQTFIQNNERNLHFIRRIRELDRSPADTVIVCIHVDSKGGQFLADALMPGHDWQQYRDQGLKPIARGLAGKEGLVEFLKKFDPAAAEVLQEKKYAILVMDYDVARVFTAKDAFYIAGKHSEP